MEFKGNLYADDSSDDEQPKKASLSQELSQEAQPVINPSKSKYDKFVEEVKQRESLARPRTHPN